VIRRRNIGKNHIYEDAVTGQRIPGVTKLTGDGLPKPALIDWAANATAEYAVDNWERLTAMAPSQRLKVLRGGRYEAKDAAAKRGTQVHALAERLVADEKVAIPDGLDGYVRSYVRFLDDFDVRPVLASEQHGYCGTLDLIADLIDPDDPEPDPDKVARQRWLLDIKTSRSGIFGEVALQLAAYRYADTYLADGEELPMPDVDLCGGIHVRADGYDLIPVTAGIAQFRQFLYVQQVARFAAESRELVGEPIVPPHASTWELVKS
jgi:hypothetical protein